ncbi:MAG: ATP synthase F1 subunit delta [Bacteroidota bacterium]
MVEERIGHRYAKSLFGLAEEKSMLEDVYADMSLIKDVVEENRDLGMMLQSPIVNPGKKGKILELIFNDQFKSEMMPLFVSMIVKKGREMYIPSIAIAFLKLYDEAKGIMRGVLTSAVPLADGQAREIEETLEKRTGKTFVIEEVVDEELIGGFTLLIGDDLFDGSVASSLRKLKQELIK